MSKSKVKKITDFSKQPPVVKKVKEQPVSEQITPLDVAEVWVTEHWKQAVGILAGIILVIVIVTVGVHMKKAAYDNAVNELADAQDIAGLERAIASHKGNPAVVPASFRLAALYIGEKNYVQAYNVLKVVAADAETDIFIRSRAGIDCAGFLEMQGKNAEAVKELELIANNMSVSESQRAEAAYNGARIAASSGDKASAERLLGVINTSRAMVGTQDPYAIWAFKAVELKDSMQAKAPAAKPAAAPASEAKKEAAAPAAADPAPAKK